jgi:di/tricarboxylate transporter
MGFSDIVSIVSLLGVSGPLALTAVLGTEAYNNNVKWVEENKKDQNKLFLAFMLGVGVIGVVLALLMTYRLAFYVFPLTDPKTTVNKYLAIFVIVIISCLQIATGAITKEVYDGNDTWVKENKKDMFQGFLSYVLGIGIVGLLAGLVLFASAIYNTPDRVIQRQIASADSEYSRRQTIEAANTTRAERVAAAAQARADRAAAAAERRAAAPAAEANPFREGAGRRRH